MDANVAKLLHSYRLFLGSLLFVIVIIVSYQMGWLPMSLFREMVGAARGIISDLTPGA
jgi:hypothetical protein